MLRVMDDTLHQLSVVWSITREPVRNTASWPYPTPLSQPLGTEQSLPAISSPARGFESLCSVLRMIELLSVFSLNPGQAHSSCKGNKRTDS